MFVTSDGVIWPIMRVAEIISQNYRLNLQLCDARHIGENIKWIDWETKPVGVSPTFHNFGDFFVLSIWLTSLTT